MPTSPTGRSGKKQCAVCCAAFFPKCSICPITAYVSANPCIPPSALATQQLRSSSSSCHKAGGRPSRTARRCREQTQPTLGALVTILPCSSTAGRRTQQSGPPSCRSQMRSGADGVGPPGAVALWSFLKVRQAPVLGAACMLACADKSTSSPSPRRPLQLRLALAPCCRDLSALAPHAHSAPHK